MTKIFVPTGKLSAKRREFKSVVADIRHAVFVVVRLRPAVNGLYNTVPLGSGFFVSSSVFVTCWHVIDSPQSPHHPDDRYLLVNNLNGKNGMVFEITGGVGKDIHLFPDVDFAIILCHAKPDQAYIPIGYADLPVGAEIGVAGYPLPNLTVDANGNANVEGLVYRVAKGNATAVYRTNVDAGDGHPLQDTPVVEVNFLFVPGNSGGPVFDAETGRAFAYVKGSRTPKISERLETCTHFAPPPGMPNDYIAGIYAIYSLGLTLHRVRPQLESFGVKL